MKGWIYNSIPVLRMILLVPVLLALLDPTVAIEEKDETLHHDDDSWQHCEIFLAPSSLRTGGWGVYAARDFERNEVVEIAARYIAVPKELVKDSVLIHYTYGIDRWQEQEGKFKSMSGVIFGMTMFYNHHGVEPNIRWASFGRAPILLKEPNNGLGLGFVARRNIEAGEELFSTYGEEDGGKDWFAGRKLEQMLLPTYASRKNGTVYKEDKQKYCSKVYAGLGKPTWEERVLTSLENGLPYKMNTQRLAPIDHPFAVVNQDIAAGTVLEIAPALVVSKHKVLNTPLAPLSFFWDDLNEAQKNAMVELRESGDLLLQHQDDSTGWLRVDRFDNFENVVLLPAAGNIALVQRLGQEGKEDTSSSPNCELNILSSGSMKSHVSHGGADGNAGILLQLVASKDIKTGQLLKLDVPSNASPSESRRLVNELRRGGQPVPSILERYFGSSADDGDGRDEL